MAQTGYTPISIYYSSTAAATPTAGNLVAGELAINTADGKLFYKDSAGAVQVIAGKGGAGVAGGSNTQVQYNSSGSLAGSANMTFSGTALTLANDASISGLTVGKGAGSQGANTAFGVSALAANTTGNAGVAIGYGAVGANTTGTGNIGIGYLAIGSGNGGGYNTAVGTQALVSATASYNSAYGYQSLFANTSGTENSAFGRGSMLNNTTGTNNTAIGSQALISNTTASNNTAVGFQAGYSNTTGAQIAAFGYKALYLNTTASNNSAFGPYVLYSNTTGTANAAFGNEVSGSFGATLGSNTTGSYNTAFGVSALQANTTASNNTAVGYQAGYSNTTGAYNVFLGIAAGYSSSNSTTGNTCVGSYAGYSLTSGSANTFVGYGGSGFGGAGSAVTTGSKNTILGGFSGNQGGLDIRTDSNVVVLSDGDGNRVFTSYNGGTVALQGAVVSNGVGIAFPATQSASSNANTLDDYEEGTWTPTLATGWSGVSYGSQNGTYTKIGRLVNVTCYMQITGTNTGANITVSGLPFAPNTTSSGNGGTVTYWDVTTDSGLSVWCASSTTVSFYKIGTSTTANATGNVTNKIITFSMVYWV